MNEECLPNFSPRDYQISFLESMDDGCKRAVLVWHRRCVAENSRILMSDGSWKFIQEVSEGDSVLSWNGHSLEKDTVVSSFYNGKRYCSEYSIYGAESLLVTKDHRVLCSYSYFNPKWKPIGNLNAGEGCFTYFNLNLGGENIPKLARFIGYMISDEYCNGYQQPKYTTTSKLIKEDFMSLVRDLFPSVYLIERVKGNGWDIGMSKGECGNKIKHPVKECLMNLGLWCTKKDKRIPKCIWSCNEESFIEFISAVIEADGNIYCQKTGRQASTYIRPKAEIKISIGESEALAWDYYYLLKKHGIQCGAVYNDRNWCWTVRIWEASSVKRLLNIIKINEKKSIRNKAIALEMKERERRKYADILLFSKPKESGASLCNTYDLEIKNNKNFISNGYIVHNSGKEVVCFNWLIKQAFVDRVGTYVYFFPTSRLGKRILWDGINGQGKRFLDYIPKRIIDGEPNSVEMKVKLINGSVIQIVGTDQILNVGINPIGCIFSEFSLQDPYAWEFVRPILRENKGWAVFNFTPRGANWAYDLFVMAKNNPDWFCQKLTIEDTKVISEEEIQKEREEGMSEELIQQEFFCSFNQGIEGSYYGRYVDELRRNNRIINLPYDPNLEVNTFWDLGFGDSTSILFVQFSGKEIRIIDSYENSGEGLAHYAKILQNKNYIYGTHYAPHDIESGHLSIGKSLKYYAFELGIRFETIPKTEIEFGIECARSLFPYLWIDENKNKFFLKCIENYHKKFNSKENCYSTTPHHDWSSHFADAFRYLGVAYKTLLDNKKRMLTPEKIREMKQKALSFF